MKIIAQVLKDFYEHEPGRVAITLQHPDQPDYHITYRELLERSNDYATAYARGGVEPGDMVVLILQHGKEIVYSFWGAILAGVIPSIMPFQTEKLSPERYRADISALLSISRPAAIVTYPEFEVNLRQISLESNSSVREVLVTDRIPRQDKLDFPTLLGLNSKETDLMVVQHSSGSTGLQKGIALSQRAIFDHLDHFMKAIGLTREDVIVSWLPLYHDYGLVDNFLMPVMNGVHVIQMSPFDWVREPWRLLRAISDYRGTLTFLPNFAYNFCANKVRERDIEGVDLSSWHTSINAGEPVRFKSHQMFYERFKSHGLRLETMQNAYGMAEVVCLATLTPNNSGKLPYAEEIDRESLISERMARPAITGRPSISMVSCGKPLPNTTIRVVDEKGRELPERHIGEIVLKSDCMLSEYYHRPDLTKQAFMDGDWIKSGDYGYMFNGEVFFTGRKKDMIIVGGKNIYPQDLEALAGEVPGVHPGRTVALGLYDESQGTEIVVLIAEVDTTEKSEQDRIANEIRDYVTMNSAVAIRRVQVVGPKWILKTTSGKFARAANKDKFLQEFGAEQEALS
jgi:fatty-acyl-CoA synthase